MNPSAARKGSSFAGVVGYITHDVGEKSSERVAFTHTLNMRTADPAKAAKVMAWTALHASELKEAAGIQATGRKGENPVYHFSLNWEPGETIAQNEMVAAAGSVLRALGYEEHEAVLAAHTDKAHRHLHIVVNRVHPMTGKTHNPNNDYDRLQRWAYQYEKDRGRVVCLDRAIKYEKDKALKAEYKNRREVELAAGEVRESKPRPKWEAEKGATHPKSQLYQEIKGRFALRANTLADAGRASAKRRSGEWSALQERQAEERAALQPAAPISPLGETFARAAGGKPRRAPAAKAALRKAHVQEMRDLRAATKAKDAPDVKRLADRQRADWREFFALAKAQASPAMKKVRESVVAATASIPVGQQGPEHRDRLAALFAAQTFSPAERKAEFAKLMDAEKKAFFGYLAKRNAPAFEQLKARQQEEVRAIDKEQRGPDVRAEKAALLVRHRDERAALRHEHREEIEAQRAAWATLNADRAQAWADYKAYREAQAGQRSRSGDSTQDATSERSLFADHHDYAREHGLSESFGDAAKDVHRDAGQLDGRDSGGGREIGRRGPG